jgi:hypothetical protein
MISLLLLLLLLSSSLLLLLLFVALQPPQLTIGQATVPIAIDFSITLLPDTPLIPRLADEV